MKDVIPSSIICTRGKTEKPAAAFRIGLRNSIFYLKAAENKERILWFKKLRPEVSRIVNLFVCLETLLYFRSSCLYDIILRDVQFSPYCLLWYSPDRSNAHPRCHCHIRYWLGEYTE